MKRKKIIRASAVCLTLALFIGSAAEALADKQLNMRVDESIIERTVEPEMYGINLEWRANMEPTVQEVDEKGNIVLRQSAIDTLGPLFGFTREAGSSSSEFKWKDSLGPMSQRKDWTMWYETGPAVFGIVEWLQLVHAKNPHAKLTYVVNITTDTLENMADIVEFMTGDGSVNYNGGVNWAEVRKSYGFEEPIDMFCWEIGNELDWGTKYGFKNSSGVVDDDKYMKKVGEAIDTIRSVDKDAKICIHTRTDAHANPDGWETWHRRCLEMYGDKIDYMSFHYYFPAGYIRRADPVLDVMENDIKQITGSDRIKLYYSEVAPASSSEKYNKDDPFPYMLPHTIYGATGQAEMYLRAWLRPSVAAMTSHALDSHVQQIVSTMPDGTSRLTAHGDVMMAFREYGVGKVCHSELDTYSKDESSDVAGGVIETADGGVNLFFLNRNDTEKVTVNFSFNGNRYRVKHVRRIHGDVRSADRWYREGEAWVYNNPNGIDTTDEDVPESGELTSYTFDPLSLYVLCLEKIN